MAQATPMIAPMLEILEANGPTPETRPEATTEGLVERFPELAAVEITPVTIDGPNGHIAARTYRGPDATDSGLLWLHGGAWVGGNLDMPEAHWVAMTIAAAGIPVVSADYIKALHGVHFPAPSDDAVHAWRWAVEHLDADRMFIGGASAGANLAAGAAKRVRDGDGRAADGVVLAYPLLHAELPPYSGELAAAIEPAPPGVFIFEPNIVRELTLNLVGDDALFSDPYAFAANGDLAGLPPHYIVNSEFDSLRASGEVFADLLTAAGVDVVSVTEPGTAHGHLDQPLEPGGTRSLDAIVAWLIHQAA